MRFQVSLSGNWQRAVEAQKRRAKEEIRRAARIAVDQAGTLALEAVREGMRSAGLGRLGFAVGESSALKKRDPGLWAVLYAKGQRNPDSRSAGALEAYTEGVTIKAKPGSVWLAYSTPAIPKFVGLRRMTPDLYKSSGLEARLGKLMFRPTKRRGVALLIVRNVTVSPKNGRARRAGPRAPRTRISQREIVVFVLIRYTRRAKRFDHLRVIQQYANQVPKLMEAELIRRNGGA